MRKVLLLLIASLSYFGCATSPRLVEQGFDVETLGAGEWLVRFEAESMSKEAARDNLLYHAARHVIDHGGLYFRVDETEEDSRLERESSASVSQEPSLGNPSGESYKSEVSVEQVVSVSGILRIVSDPDGAMDASRVLEELTRKYSRE